MKGVASTRKPSRPVPEVASLPALPEQETLLSQVRAMAVNSSLYFTADAVARGLNLLLVVAYTQVLQPADYAVLAVATAVTLLVVPMIGLLVTGSLQRFYFEAASEEERRRLYTTTLAFLIVVPTLVVAVIEVVGQLGWLDVFDAVPYDPYLRLAVLAAYASLFLDLPISIYLARRQARRVAGLTLANAALLVGFSVLLVVGLGQGVKGVLLGTLLAGGTMAVVALFLTVRAIGVLPRPSRAMLVAMLAFSAPLVPHSVAQWGLQVSDRTILSHYVPSSELGLYYLGYSVGSIGIFVVFAAGKAMHPIITAELKRGESSSRVPHLGTYWFAGLIVSCLGIALYAPDAVKILAPNEFLRAAEIVPIIALASAVYGVYTIVSSGVWYSMRTGWVPALTGISAALNIGLNLLLIPSFGIKAAAWNTVAGFAALAVLLGILATRQHPIAWEYRRWSILAGSALGAYFAVELVAPGLSVENAVLSLLALVVVFPAALTVTGFWSAAERRWLRERLSGA